jgi:hypothetical protein
VNIPEGPSPSSCSEIPTALPTAIAVWSPETPNVLLRAHVVEVLMLLLIIILILLFGGGGGYYGYSRWGMGGGLGILGTVLLIVLILYLLGAVRL